MNMRSTNIAVLFVFLVSLIWSAPAHAGEVYDRVMKSQTIRCGYISWAPYLIQNANTGEFSGLSYEYMEALGKELDLEIEWTEETGWGTFYEGLKAGRFDVMCVPIWRSGHRARHSLLSEPVYLNSMFAFVREDDNRFETLESLNVPDVTIAVFEGDITQVIRKQKYPEAHELAIVEMSGAASSLLSVADGKADAVIMAPGQVEIFNREADVKLKAAANGQQVRSFENVLAVPLHEFALKTLLDAGVMAFNRTDAYEDLIARFQPEFSSARIMYEGEQ